MGDRPGALVIATHDRRLREALSLERESRRVIDVSDAGNTEGFSIAGTQVYQSRAAREQAGTRGTIRLRDGLVEGRKHVFEAESALRTPRNRARAARVPSVSGSNPDGRVFGRRLFDEISVSRELIFVFARPC